VKLLIEDLLTISELESGRLRLTVQTVKLRALVAKVFEEYESRAHTRKMELMNECPELECMLMPRGWSRSWITWWITRSVRP
jgi:signal transduction histidine kinase